MSALQNSTESGVLAPELPQFSPGELEPGEKRIGFGADLLTPSGTGDDQLQLAARVINQMGLVETFNAQDQENPSIAGTPVGQRYVVSLVEPDGGKQQEFWFWVQHVQKDKPEVAQQILDAFLAFVNGYFTEEVPPEDRELHWEFVCNPAGGAATMSELLWRQDRDARAEDYAFGGATTDTNVSTY